MLGELEGVHQGKTYRLSRDDLPETYVFHSEPSSSILFNPALAGHELKHQSFLAAKEFLGRAHPLHLKGEKPENICEVVLLSGGNYYCLADAFEEVFGASIRQAYIGIKRYQLPSKKWDARTTYDSLDSLPNNATILIGDTIATGSTLRKAIWTLADEYKARGYALKKIIVYTLVGADVGGKLLKELERELQSIWPKFSIVLFASEALFGLEKNGTDMPFFHEDTLMTPEAQKLLLQHPAMATSIKCAIFDWGDRCKNPEQHYEEFIEYCNGLLEKGEMNDSSAKEVLMFKKEAEFALRKAKTPV